MAEPSLLAADPAFNGFPSLASILSADGYLPTQLARRGDRLVFSNGIVLLALLAVGLIAWMMTHATGWVPMEYLDGTP